MKNVENRVLVVEDNQNMGSCLVDMIEELNCPADLATSGSDAVSMLKEQEYTLVISDTRMPGMSGFDLLKHIRSNHPNICVALMSTRNSDFTQGLVVKGKADYYLPKPIKMTEIGKILAAVKV